MENNNQINISTNQPIQIKNTKLKNKHNVYKILFYCVLPIAFVAIAFNILSLIPIQNKSCNININLAGSMQSSTNEELLIGENYVCNIDLKSLNLSYIDKTAEVQIIIKKANVIKEVGYFNNINFEDFTYNNETNEIIGKTFINVDLFNMEKINISFNFCPTAVGQGDLMIKVLFNDKLVQNHTNKVKL